MRVAIVAAAVLICSSQSAPLSAIEFVALRFSCTYTGNEVELVPSTPDRLHVVLSDREQRIIRTCAPGSAEKCRPWAVHRFDVLCGDRQVSWRMIAEQLLNFTPVPATMGNASVRAPLEAWELRALRSEPGFAPVDELGARIFSFAVKPALESAASRRASDVNTGIASEAGNRTLRSSKFEPDSLLSKRQFARGADAVQSGQSQTSVPQSALISPPLSAPRQDGVEDRTGSTSTPPRLPADEAGTKAAEVAKFDLLKGEVDSAAAANLPTVQTAARDNPFIALFVPQRWDGEHAGRFLVVLAATLLLTFAFLTIVHAALARRKSAFGQRAVPGQELHSSPTAEACHELMKQVASDLMRATSAVNGLHELPVLQSTLYRELNSIRRPLGSAAQTQGRPGEKEDWHRIKLQLIMSLQGTQRIIEIAQAARASVSFHPVTRQDVTTRLDAFAFLGVNATSSEIVLRKTVNALRLCWHPDLATDENDRHLREARIKQINVAWDLITGKRMSAC